MSDGALAVQTAMREVFCWTIHQVSQMELQKHPVEYNNNSTCSSGSQLHLLCVSMERQFYECFQRFVIKDEWKLLVSVHLVERQVEPRQALTQIVQVHICVL